MTDLFAICNKLKELEINDVLLTGGEIFFSKDILNELCSNLKEQNITLSFSTAFISKKDFINQLFSYKPKSLNISFDPEYIGGTKLYKNNLKDVEYILQMAELNDISIKITGIINKGNFKNYDNYVKDITILIDKYKYLSSVYLTNPYDIGYLKMSLRVSYDKQKKIYDDVIKLENNKIKLVNFPRFNSRLQKCQAAKYYIHMEPNGNIYPCHLFANYNKDVFFMGNILNDSIKDIATNLNMFQNQIDDSINDYKKEFPECIECKSKADCYGGCLAEVISIGQLIEPQFVCKNIPYPKNEYYKPPEENFLNFQDTPSDLLQSELSIIDEYIRSNIRKQQHDLAHGYDHIKSVVKLSRFLAQEEGANLRIVTAAAYFHDFAPRRKLIFESHTKLSANLAVDFLKRKGFNDNELKEIYLCIDTSSYGASELGFYPMSLEAKIVRDADWLDAIGARGIARVFAFGAAHGCETLGEVEWDIDEPIKKRMSMVGPDPSPIYHFFSKLLWIKDNIITESGKKIAEIRHKRLCEFLKNYQNEMDENSFMI